ncbi:MAG: glycosyltransferase family 4 protein [Saprospiraceae bacterium]
MEKIVFAHLYNDYSGSPLVLSTVIKGFLNRKTRVELITSTSEGFLSELDLPKKNNAYRFHQHKFLRLITFLFCQIRMFFQALQYREEQVVFYVNTLLPFGVALAAKLMNKKVVYHLHETSVRPIILKRFLKWVASVTATELVYVSDFLRKEESIKGVTGSVVPNALSKAFLEQASSFQNEQPTQKDFVVLMICSLKAYKGVNEFVALAKQLPQLQFEMVLNATQPEIDHFFAATKLSTNLSLFPKQANVHPFYQRASLVLNLSHPQLWVETFGMTLLEGMAYGIPAISPPVGGPVELIHSGKNGYQIDQRALPQIIERITQLSTNEQLYQSFSQQARIKAATFNVERMQESLFNLIYLSRVA